MVRKFLLLVSLAFVVSGCGDVPRPFQGDGVYIQPEILHLPDSVGVFITPPEKMEKQTAIEFAREISVSLQSVNIPASVNYKNVGSYTLKGRVRPKTRRMEEGVTDRLFWTLYEENGDIAGKFGSNITASEMPLRTAAHSVAAEIAILLQDPDSTVTPSKPDAYKFFVAPVTGAPGNGNAALTKGLLSELNSRGASTARRVGDANIVVQCQFTITKPNKGKQRVKIVWIVGEDKDREIGRITQNNIIPAGSLDGDWGATAQAIAVGGVNGIAQILENRK